MSKSKDALLDDRIFPVSEIEVKENIRDVSENDPDLKELAQSIKEYGQLEPIGIGIERDPISGKFPLIYGHRRFKAISKILKEKTVKVVQLIPGGREETQLIENIHRKDLSDYEIAKTLKEIKEKTGKKNKELTKIVFKSIDWIESKLKHIEILEELPDEIKEEAKKLSTDKVNPLRRASKEKKAKIIKETLKNNLPVKKIREKAKSETSRKSRKKDPQDTLKAKKTELKNLSSREAKLRNELEAIGKEKVKILKDIQKLEGK